MAKPKRNTEEIIEAGMQVLYAKGYNLAGMQDIAKASNMTKGSLYGYFKSKEDFATQVIDHYTEILSKELSESLLSSEGSPIEKLKTLLTNWADDMFSTNGGCGCLAGNMSQEVANHSPVMRQAISKSFNTLEAIYYDCLKAAVDKKELFSNIDLSLTASLIYNGWQGAMVRAKADQDSAHLYQFIEYVFTRLLVK